MIDRTVEEASHSVMEAAVAKAKTALEGEDVEAITAAAAELEQASHKLAEALYKKAQEEGAAADAAAGAETNGASAAPEDGGDDDENVVDADFEEVKNP